VPQVAGFWVTIDAQARASVAAGSFSQVLQALCRGCCSRWGWGSQKGWCWGSQKGSH